MVNVLLRLSINAVPLAEAPGAVHSFMTRGVHMGALLMVVCIAKHLMVPIINMHNLIEFFNSDQVCLIKACRLHLLYVNGTKFKRI